MVTQNSLRTREGKQDLFKKKSILLLFLLLLRCQPIFEIPSTIITMIYPLCCCFSQLKHLLTLTAFQYSGKFDQNHIRKLPPPLLYSPSLIIYPSNLLHIFYISIPLFLLYILSLYFYSFSFPH